MDRPQNPAADSSALELDLDQIKPQESPRRKRGRPKSTASTWPECPHCKGRYKLLSQHLPNCAMRPAVAPEPVKQTVTVEITSTSIGIVIAGGFDLVALRKKDPEWHLKPIEAEALGVSWKAVVDAYWPDAGQQKIVILLLALANTLEVLKSRMRHDRIAATRTPGPPVYREGGNGQDNALAGNPPGDGASPGF